MHETTKVTNKYGIEFTVKIHEGEMEPYIVSFHLNGKNMDSYGMYSYYVSTFMSVVGGVSMDGSNSEMVIEGDSLREAREFIISQTGEFDWAQMDILNGAKRQSFEKATEQRYPTMMANPREIQFNYTDWKGVQSERKTKMLGMYIGKNEYHDERQWYVVGIDSEKNEERHYALKDMRNVRKVGNY